MHVGENTHPTAELPSRPAQSGGASTSGPVVGTPVRYYSGDAAGFQHQALPPGYQHQYPQHPWVQLPPAARYESRHGSAMTHPAAAEIQRLDDHLTGAANKASAALQTATAKFAAAKQILKKYSR